MRILGDTIKNGDQVQFILNNDIYGNGGEAIVENGNIIRVDLYNNKGSVYPIDIHTIALNNRDINVMWLVRHEILLEQAQKYALENHPELPTYDINSDMIAYTEYQRALFEMRYPYKDHLNHINFFRPSACYYPKGWYDLGGEGSEESDRIGELVENAWQTWRDALFQNKLLGNITPEKITYKGS